MMMMVTALVVARLGNGGSSTWIALRDMLYRSNIENDDDDDDDADDDGGSIHVSIQYTTTTIYSWAEFKNFIF